MSKKKDIERGMYNWHHRKPKKLGGSGKITSPNMIEVPVVQHRAWHTLFGIQTPADIAKTINATWLDPEWEMVAVRKVKTVDLGRKSEDGYNG